MTTVKTVSTAKTVMAPLRRGLRAILVAAVVLLVTTACVEIDEEITFNADGSGTYELTVLMDTTVLEEGAQTDPFAAELLKSLDVTEEQKAEARSKYGPNATLESASENYDGKPYRGSHLKAPFSSTSQFNTIASSATSQNGTTDPASAYNLTVQGNVYTLTGRMDPLTPPSGQEAELLADAERYLKITVTGAVVEHNADERDGLTFYWTIYAAEPAKDVKLSWRPRG